MKIIRPITISESDVSSTNLTESTAEWSSATNYTTVGTQVKVTGTGGGAASATHKIYESVKAAAGTASSATTASGGANVGDVEITLASAGTGTIVQGDSIQFANDSNVYVVAAGDSDVSDGGTIILEAPGLLEPIEHSATNITVVTNTNKDPTTDTTEEWWSEVSAVNNMKMFNNIPQQQASRSGGMSFTFRPGENFNALALIGVFAQSVDIVVTSDVSGEIYNENHDLVDTGFITDMYDFYFEPVQVLPDFAITDIPITDDSTVAVTLNQTGTTLLGCCVVGQYADLGNTEPGSRFGLVNYSRIVEDATTGERTKTTGALAKRADVRCWAEIAEFNGIYIVLSSLIDEIICYIGTDTYSGSIIFGYLRDFEVDLANVSTARYKLRIEGVQI